MDYVIVAVVSVVFALAGAIFVMRRKSQPFTSVQTHTSLLEMKSVGELVVFRVVTKEIVTASKHWFGSVGENYLSWLVSGKKMAMIFVFGIDFKYDLRSQSFVIEETPAPGGGTHVTMHMPPCTYETHLRDVSFYDEQSAKLLPGLMPDVISNLFGGGLSEHDKNRLVETARAQADTLARAMVERMTPEVQNSAEQTLRTLARGFGAKQIKVDFTASKLVASGKADVRMLENLSTQGG
jgi:hypothetical protein